MYYVIASGKKKTKYGHDALKKVEDGLKKRNAEYKIFVSAQAGHTIDLARECSSKDDCTAIIAVGGDGTFYEVLNGMDTSKPIGFVPCGTGNDFARTLGITPDVEECLDNIFNNKPKYVDYLKIGDHRAFNVVGTGFDILLLEKEKELRNKYNDKQSYQAALISTILHCKFEDLEFRIDDGEWKREKIFMIEACNGKWGGGMMPLCLDADPHDGILDFIIIKKFFKPFILFLLLVFQSGKLYKTKYMERYKCKKVEIDVKPRLKANLDGELMHLFPLTVEIVHNELKYFPSSKAPKDPFYLLKHKKEEA